MCPEDVTESPTERASVVELSTDTGVEAAAASQPPLLKILVWLFMAMLLTTCAGCWEFSSFFKTGLFFSSYRSRIPEITLRLFYPNTWLLLFPIPWLPWLAILSCRLKLTTRPVFYFCSPTIVAAILIFIIVVIAIKAVENVDYILLN
jgi:hypothetical protein